MKRSYVSGIVALGVNISATVAFVTFGSHISSKESSSSWPLCAKRKTESRSIDIQASKTENDVCNRIQKQNNRRESSTQNGKVVDAETRKSYNVIEMMFVTSIKQTENVAPSSKSEQKLAENENIQDILLLVGLCWCVALLSALDRVAMSVAVLPMSTEFGYTESMKGAISSFFSVGYGLFILPCGLIVSQASPRLVMAGGVLLWSLSTAATPIAAGISIEALLAVRCVMGAAESVVLPTINKLLVNWIPPDRKSLATATIYSGFSMGTISAYLASPFILDNFGWRNLFFVYGAIGSLWLVPWLSLATNTPDEANRKRLILPGEGRQSDYDKRSQNTNSIQEIWHETTKEGAKILAEAPLNEMLKSNGVRAMAIAHAASNWGLYNNLAWSPTFYSEQYGLNVKESALFSILPSIAGATCGILSALVADKLIAEGTDVTLVRRIFQGIGLLGPAACLLTLAHDIPEAPIAAQLLLTGSVGFQAFNAAGFGAASQEKAGDRWAGLLYSLTSLPGVAFGSIGVFITGKILDSTGQWDLVFGLNGIVNAIAAAFFISFYDSQKEFD